MYDLYMRRLAHVHTYAFVSDLETKAMRLLVAGQRLLHAQSLEAGSLEYTS